MRVVPPSMPPAARPLPPLPPLTIIIGVAVTTGAITTLTGLPCRFVRPTRSTRARRRLLRRATEQHPRQHCNLLDQLLDPGLRPLSTLLRLLCMLFGTLGTLAPERHLGDVNNQQLGPHPKIQTHPDQKIKTRPVWSHQHPASRASHARSQRPATPRHDRILTIDRALKK